MKFGNNHYSKTSISWSIVRAVSIEGKQSLNRYCNDCCRDKYRAKVEHLKAFKYYIISCQSVSLILKALKKKIVHCRASRGAVIKSFEKQGGN